MSLSDDIKRQLVTHFAGQGLETTTRSWKRLSKTNVDDYVVRSFEDAGTGLSVITVTVDEEDDGAENVCIWETGPIGFAVRDGEEGVHLSFTPMTHWTRTGLWPSIDDYAHLERGIEALPLQHCGDGCGDNRFSILAEEVGGIRAELVAQGYVDLTGS